MKAINRNKITHGPSQHQEFTLCGLALDGVDSDDGQPLVAQPGELVTCQWCQNAIQFCADCYNGYYVKRGWGR